MAKIEPGLFGYDPTELQQANQQRWATLYGQAGSPYEKMGMALGQIGGAALSGLFGVEDPAISANKEATALASKYDLYSAAGLKDYTMALQQRAQETGNPQLAAIVPRAAEAYQKAALAEATIEQKTREKQVNVGEQVNQQLFAKFQQDAIKMGATPDQVDLVAAQLYDRYENDKKVRVASAAVPAPGQVPLTTIKQAQDIVGEYTAKPLEKLNQIKTIGALGAGVKSNPTLMPTFQKEVAGFVKDNQISNKDFERALGSSGIAADAIDSVNKFFTGAPTNAKIDDILKGWKLVEKIYADQYNTGRKKAATVLEQGKIAPETQASILPPAYNIKPRVAAPAVGAIVDNHKFMGGNPADPKNWKAL